MKITIRRGAAATAVLALAATGTALGGAGAHANVATQKVTVGLKEFRLLPSTKRLRVGKLTLVAVNRGTMPHALEIKGPGVKARTAMLQPGHSARLTVTLKTGTYSLWCPVSNHAALGMKLSVKVGGTASPTAEVPAAPAPTTSTTPAGGGYDNPGYGY